MASPNFTSLLDQAPTEVVRPKAAPVGSYLWIVKGLPRIDKSSKKQTEFTEFTLQCVAAGNDVDKDDLETWLTAADGSKKTISDLIMQATFYSTEKSIYMLDEFHENCGIDLSAPNKRTTRSEECVNHEVVGYIRHEASNDGKSTFARFGKWAKAEDFIPAED